MVHTHLNRRQFVGTVTAVTTVGLAGCNGDGGDGGDGGNATDGTGESPTSMETEPATGTEGETDDGETEDDETATEGDDTDALVRAVHASPDAPNVDVYVDDESVLSDVAFRTVSDYLSLAAGSYQVRITAAGDEETVVFDEEVPVSGGSAASLVALGEMEADTFEIRPFEDDVSGVGEGEARIRALHASPDAPAVDIAVEGEDEPLLSELSFGEASEYATVPADAYTLEVRASGETEAVASFDVDLETGMGYTAFAMGYLNPDEAAVDEPFDLTLATDTTESESSETTEGESTETTDSESPTATDDETQTTDGTEPATTTAE